MEGVCGLKKIAVNRWCFGNSLTVECGRLPAGSQTPQNLNRKLTALFGCTTRTTGRNGKQAIPFPNSQKRPREEKRSLPAEEEEQMKPYKTMTLRLNATEYAHLCRQAEVTGLKKEPLVRQLIMGVNLRPRPPDALCRPAPCFVCHRQQHQSAGPSSQRQGVATGDEITEALHLVRQATRLVRGAAFEWRIRRSLSFIADWTGAWAIRRTRKRPLWKRCWTTP